MIGCPVGCIFCASGENGFVRNLTPSEIVQQVILINGRVNRIVFMGMGEPLFNYDNVIKSIHILRDRKGLDFPTDGITISTTGPLPQMKKLREEHLKIQLTLSLHATNQHVRDYYAKPFVQTLFSKNNELSSHRFCLQSVCYQTCFVNFIRSFVVQPLMNPFTIEELYKFPETFSQFLCT